MTSFSSVLHWSQVKHQHIVIFKIINGDWGNIILKVHCFHGSHIKTTIVSSIKIYNWLSPSEYSNLSETKLLIPDWVFCKRTSKGRVCVHCSSNPTNGSIVENVLLNELVLSRRYDECLCQCLQIVLFYRSISEHVHSLFVIIILESNTTSVKWTIHNSKTDIGVVANHVKIGSSSD